MIIRAEPEYPLLSTRFQVGCAHGPGVSFWRHRGGQAYRATSAGPGATRSPLHRPRSKSPISAPSRPDTAKH